MVVVLVVIEQGDRAKIPQPPAPGGGEAISDTSQKMVTYFGKFVG